MSVTTNRGQAPRLLDEFANGGWYAYALNRPRGEVLIVAVCR